MTERITELPEIPEGEGVRIMTVEEIDKVFEEMPGWSWEFHTYIGDGVENAITYSTLTRDLGDRHYEEFRDITNRFVTGPIVMGTSPDRHELSMSIRGSVWDADMRRAVWFEQQLRERGVEVPEPN